MLSFEDIQNIDLEEKPGIYTFYYKPIIENYDLYLDDDELGAVKFTEIIDERFILPMCNQVMNVEFSLNFEQSLNGRVKNKNKAVNKKRFNSKILNDGFNALEEFKDKRMRVAFKSFFEAMPFHFSKPIYIGVSHNIKERLLEHYEAFFYAKSMIYESAEMSDDNFGVRAALFAKENEIFFTVQYVDSENIDLNRESSYKMALMMEWVLNQQNTPILGRK
ncbi:hypothetical protein KW497_01525 [Vibrio fluvialis]|nr:hypothetical protein [Vibrio fluvialis]MBY8122665.1 hypothetical protein [Vibrio fluvialis]